MNLFFLSQRDVNSLITMLSFGFVPFSSVIRICVEILFKEELLEVENTSR